MFTAWIMYKAMWLLYTQAKEAIIFLQVNLQLWMYNSRFRPQQLLQRKRFIQMTAFYTWFSIMFEYKVRSLWLCRQEGHCAILEQLLGESKRTNSNTTTQVTQTLEPPPVQQIAASQVAIAASLSINVAIALQSTNVSSSNSFSMQFWCILCSFLLTASVST